MVSGLSYLLRTNIWIQRVIFCVTIPVIFCGVWRGYFIISLMSNTFSKCSSHCSSDMSLACLVFNVNFLILLQNCFGSPILLSSSFLHFSLYSFSLVKSRCLYCLWKFPKRFSCCLSHVSTFLVEPFIWKHFFATLFFNQTWSNLAQRSCKYTNRFVYIDINQTPNSFNLW